MTGKSKCTSVRKVLMLAYPGCQALDVVGPVDALTLTNEACDERGEGAFRYEIELIAPDRGDLKTNGSVLRLGADRAMSEVSDAELAQVDTFMIAGGSSTIALRGDRDVIEFIQRASNRAKRVASVCTAALLLAEAGVLDGHRVTTHWRVATMLDDDYPAVTVTPDSLVCHDGKIWSSGGISAGVDLTLAIVEHDLGAEVARSVARMMVMFLARPGGQSQFGSSAVELEKIPPQADARAREIIDLIRMHPEADLRRSALAERFSMTERTLARHFRSFTGMTIARFVEEARISHARVRLEDSDEKLELVAHRSGFGSADSMRRIFMRRLSISPQDYRARFKSAFANGEEE